LASVSQSPVIDSKQPNAGKLGQMILNNLVLYSAFPSEVPDGT